MCYNNNLKEVINVDTAMIFEFFTPIVKSLVLAIIVLTVGLNSIRFFTKRLNRFLEKTTLDETLKPFISSLFNTLSKIFLGIIMISILGVDVSSFVAVLASLGFAIGLAFQGSLSNFAGGVLLLTMRPFKVGDFVESNGLMGTVQAIQILYTKLSTIDNKIVYIPNGRLANDNIINFTEQEYRMLDLVFSVSYSSDNKKVKKILEDIINKHESVIKDDESKPTLVKMLSHGDSSIDYRVRGWTRTEDFWNAFYDVQEKVKEEFDKKGIEIPFPQMDVHLKNN